MKVLRLIAPSWAHALGHNIGRSLFPPLSLAVLAGLTPPDWDVSIVDESVERINFDQPADLVGVTAMTAVAPRAYQIAAEYRKRGVPVVLGGIHPTALPAEAAANADSVVIGEAEPVWGQVLADALKGKLQRFYTAAQRPLLDGLPLPRRELFRPDRYLTMNTVQTSRGCPFSCSFCSVTRFFGCTYRMRPIADVCREIETLKDRVVLFVDDNIVGNVRRAKDLFRALIPYGLKWMGQSSINIASDLELLGLAAKSGCIGLFIGFESLVADNLASIGKRINRVEQYREAIARIHAHGIGIEGAFIFGFDEDRPSVFQRTVEFAQRARLAAAQFGILTPFPGTPLREQLEGERRITDRNWAKYTISHVVFRPAAMSAEALQSGFNWAYREFYSYSSIISRLVLGLKRNLRLFLPINISFRRIGYSLSHRPAEEVTNSDGPHE